MRRFNSDNLLFAVLALVMLATRPHPLGMYHHLPDTSLASFFVMGYFLRGRWAFPALCSLAFIIDVVVIYGLDGSRFCFTPAYAMLLPAYGLMWQAGRLAKRHLAPRLAMLPAFAVLVSIAALVSNMFSSGGFYFLSGRFAAPTLAEFWTRVETYFPDKLLGVLVWTGIAALAFGLWRMARHGGAIVRGNA